MRKFRNLLFPALLLFFFLVLLLLYLLLPENDSVRIITEKEPQRTEAETSEAAFAPLWPGSENMRLFGFTGSADPTDMEAKIENSDY